MVPPYRLVATLCAAAALSCFGKAAPLVAQAPPVHYLHQSAVPPGAIGRAQLARGGPLAGYYQPVEIKAPSGALISLAGGGQFEPPSPVVTAGMLIGQVYRLRVSHIPLLEGYEVFPTIEVIDRIYPRPEETWRFPIPIEIAQQDLELALRGRFVTRVIYLEEPRNALPHAQNPAEQNWYDVLPGENPLQVADTLGRPVAILRMGGKLPLDPGRPDSEFLFGCPPYLRFRKPELVPPPVAAMSREGWERIRR